MENKIIEIGYGHVNKVEIGNKLPLAFIGGPCAIESREHAFKMAEMIGDVCKRLDIPWIYKSCYDKDCRSSPESFHGVGVDDGLRILQDIRENFGLPVVSDFSDFSIFLSFLILAFFDFSFFGDLYSCAT